MKNKKEITLPLNNERLIAAYKSAVELLIDLKKVKLDKNGNPYFYCSGGGKYLDGLGEVKEEEEEDFGA
jgi:hypothetical protein